MEDRRAGWVEDRRAGWRTGGLGGGQDAGLLGWLEGQEIMGLRWYLSLSEPEQLG